jgi:outer membrane protein OmpA-like peptidoglycan-associated protein
MSESLNIFKGTMKKIPHCLRIDLHAFPAILALVLAFTAGCQKPKPSQTEHANSVAPASTPALVGKPAPASVTASNTTSPAKSTEPAEATPKDGPAAIPIREGLTIVTALAGSDGDYESIKKVLKTSPEEIVLSYTADQPPITIHSQRTVLRKDMENAHEYSRWFYLSSEKYPGTTAIGTSASVLEELKTKGESAFKVPPNSNLGSYQGTLHRVEDGPVPIPVIVNDERVLLHAIHAQGEFAGYKGDFYFLDDVQNPICLRFKIGIDKLNVVKIAFNPEEIQSNKSGPAAHIEQELEQTGRAEVYGIYFDFASAKIKEESKPVLQEISAILTKNPAWKLNIAGHTDNIGGDAKNLELSEKRAAAVKDALVSQYHIDAGRLETAGFGASQPKETNDTIEGRARNRRVELIRS